MQMRKIIRGVLAVGLLAAGSAAQAAMTAPSAASGSSLFVTVFDVTNNESFTTDLGLTYSDFMTLTTVATTPNAIKAGAYTPRTFNLDMAIFSDNNPANLRYNVYAGDTSGGNGLKGFIVTAPVSPSGLTNAQMNSIGTLATGLISTFNQNCPTGTGCAGSSGDESLWGQTFNANFPGNAASLGTALKFFSVTGANTPSSGGITTAAQFGNAQGTWEWQLSQSGTLTFGAEVPLPAAAWLMLSGLAGVGAFGRRRSAKKA
jgi:hypothetical protein